MKKKILNHFDLKLLSLIIAIVIWIVVANVDDYKTTKQITGIEIEFINGNAITEKNKLYEVPEGTTIDIVVKGRRSIVENLTRDDFKAVADLSKMSVTNAVSVNVSAISSLVDREIAITYTDDAINVEVEDKVEKQLPITVRAIGTVADGYAISNKIAAPNLITVKGAESVVNTIEQVVVDIDVNKASQDVVAYGEPIFIDYSGNVVGADKIECDVKSAEVTIEIKKTKELKVVVKTKGEPKEGYLIAGVDYQPTSVVVVGDLADLAKVDELLIDDIDVDDCTDVFETSIMVSDYLPSGIVIADGTQEIMIKVLIEKVKEKTLVLEKNNINLVGKNADYQYVFVDKSSIDIVISGLGDKIETLQLTDLIPSIDVSGYGPGKYKFTVNLRELVGVEIDDTYDVEIEIKSE